MRLTAVSLFAGVGGFDLAMERNGIDVVAAVEIDAKARGVLRRHFPNTELFEDVCDVTGDQLIAAGFVPDRGIITGGFPCQDLSVAGKRAGLDGARSGLFWEICRLLDETKAKWFVLENVPGLLSSNAGRDMGAVVGALVDRGYGIAWRVLDAQHYGVPQRRRRVVIVGCLGDDGRASSEVLALSESVRRDSAPGKQAGQEVAGTLGGGAGSSSGQSGMTLDFPERITGTITTCFGPKNYDGFQQVSQGSVVSYRTDVESGDGTQVIPTVTSKWAKGSGGPAGDEVQNLVTFHPVQEIVGTLSPGAHPGGLNGQDAYAGQLVIGFPEGEQVGTITTAFGPKNYSNHQDILSGSVVAYHLEGDVDLVRQEPPSAESDRLRDMDRGGGVTDVERF